LLYVSFLDSLSAIMDKSLWRRKEERSRAGVHLERLPGRLRRKT
jgi:hypothetical protein